MLNATHWLTARHVATPFLGILLILSPENSNNPSDGRAHNFTEDGVLQRAINGGSTMQFVAGRDGIMQRTTSRDGVVEGATTLSGTVRDATTGIGIGGATVSLNTTAGRSISTVTKAGGKYLLAAPTLKRGTTAQLQFTCSGYASFTRSVVLSADTVRADASLSPSHKVMAFADSAVVGDARGQTRQEAALTTAPVAPRNSALLKSPAAGAVVTSRMGFRKDAGKNDRARGSVMPAQDAELRRVRDKSVMGPTRLESRTVRSHRRQPISVGERQSAFDVFN